MNKTIVIFVLLILSMQLPLPLMAYDIEVDHIYYNVDPATRTASVSFNGSLNSSYSGDIVIPEEINYANNTLPVVGVDEYAFSYEENLNSVALPNSIKYIAAGSFRGCPKLRSVQLPEQLTEIQSNTFNDCSLLTSINFPANLKFIGKHAFMGCSSLTHIAMGNEVDSIGGGCFANCTSLIEVTFSSSLRTIEDEAFSGCTSLNNVQFPTSLMEIGAACFKDCELLSDLNIPENVLYIGASCFESCINLSRVILPLNLEEIQEKTFYKCSSLKNISLGEFLTQIGSYAFYNCGLSTIKFPNSLKKIDSYAFYESKLSEVVIPPSVNFIGNRCFSYCDNLKTVIFEDGANDLTIYQLAFANGSPTHIWGVLPIKTLYVGRNLSYGIGNFGYFEEFPNVTQLSIGKFVTDLKSEYFNPRVMPLKEINSYAAYPVLIDNFTNEQYLSIQVNIPEGTKYLYEKDNIWKKFWNLNEKLPLSILNVNLNIETAVLKIGEESSLEAHVYPDIEGYNKISWTSSNPSVAMVSHEGLIKAIGVGTAQITASCGDVSAVCEVVVTDIVDDVGYIISEDDQINVYTVNGVLIKEGIRVKELDNLEAGLYIVQTPKGSFKIQK